MPSRKRRVIRLLLPAALLCASGISRASGDGDVITANDGQGNISAVYNLFDGQTHYIRITRMTAEGGLLWSAQHSNAPYEKAYAAAMDGLGNLFVAGVRKVYGNKYFLVLKYDEHGYAAREIPGDANDCTAVKVATDRQNNVAVAGVCRFGSQNPARIYFYDNDGGLLWAQEWDGGGRNYVRGLQIDFQGNVSLTVESILGDYRSGSYETRIIVYDRDGQRIAER